MNTSMKRSVAACVLLLCTGLWFVLPVYADLNTFKEDVEQEESNNRNSERKGQADNGQMENQENDEENGGNFFARFLLEITIFAWAIHNNGVYYSAYPYAPPVSFSSGLVEGRPRNFINYDFANVQIESGEERPQVSYRKWGAKRYWFELSSGALMTEEGEFGTVASLQGRFTPFFGPDIDYRLIFDGSDELHITTAGLDFSIVQNDFFTWTAYGKGAFFDGVLNRDGWAFGSWFRMYPFRPVSLHLRTGGMFFPDITFGQVEAKMNIHLGRLLLFGGINLLESEETRRLMTEAGATVHF